MTTQATETEREAVDQLLGRVKKNTTEELRVQRTSYGGKELLDVRVWYVSPVPGSEAKPTKKGLTLRPATWAELLPILVAEVGMTATPDAPGGDDDGAEAGEGADPYAGDV